VQALGAYPAVVVCPASLKFNWQREAGLWLPGRSVVVLNGKASGDLSQADVIVLNYDILHKWQATLKARQPRAVVLDESHYLKDGRARRSKAAAELSQGVEVVLCLTGTPVLNRPKELLSQLAIMRRLDDLGGFWGFAKRYCQAHKGRYGWDMDGAAHLGELNARLRATCYLRRTKAAVLPELPAKQRSQVAVEIDNRVEYRRAATQTVAWLAEQAAGDAEFLASLAGKSREEREALRAARYQNAAFRAQKAEQLVRIEALKQVAAHGKLSAVVEWVTDALATGEKLVLFAHHREMQVALLEQFPTSARVLGEDDAQTRQANVTRFQTDPECRLIVCSLASAGVGLTLTAASNVAFCEYGWTPAVHDQAEDRCHRIGQLADSVNVWNLVARDTIEEDILDLIERKRAVVNAATDGFAPVEEGHMVSELIDRLLSRSKAA
jgi:SNF2 family DNA or RNA helicase